MSARACLLATLVILMIGQIGTAGAQLLLEGKIPLGSVSGRIDHLAIDLKRQRLFVAELGNGSVGVVDLAGGKLQNTMIGFKEPQGIGVEPASDAIYIAIAGDGSVRIARAEDLTLLGRIELGDDADNVRIDRAHQRVLVGFGKGGLAVIDARNQKKIGDIPLKAHPESFQLDETGDHAWVNLPDAERIQVVDLAKGALAASLPTQGHRGNFPMALDQDAQRLFVVFRHPARLLVLALSDHSVVSDLETCGDADDVFVDHKRQRVYVVCGEGLVDIFEDSGGKIQRISQTPTVPGARTGLFVPGLDRLFVAVRATAPEPAAIWVLRPAQ